jgi:hypothetical protein
MTSGFTRGLIAGAVIGAAVGSTMPMRRKYRFGRKMFNNSRGFFMKASHVLDQISDMF